MKFGIVGLGKMGSNLAVQAIETVNPAEPAA